MLINFALIFESLYFILISVKSLVLQLLINNNIVIIINCINNIISSNSRNYLTDDILIGQERNAFEICPVSRKKVTYEFAALTLRV